MTIWDQMEKVLDVLYRRDRGSQVQGRAANHEEARHAHAQRETRPQYEKEMYPDITEVKTRKIRTINKYDRDR